VFKLLENEKPECFASYVSENRTLKNAFTGMELINPDLRTSQLPV
jgi:hypothetical protein